jgi:hypothetical protein
MEEEKLAGQTAAEAPRPAASAVSGRVAQLMGGLDIRAPADGGDIMDDEGV